MTFSKLCFLHFWGGAQYDGIQTSTEHSYGKPNQELHMIQDPGQEQLESCQRMLFPPRPPLLEMPLQCLALGQNNRVFVFPVCLRCRDWKFPMTSRRHGQLLGCNSRSSNFSKCWFLPGTPQAIGLPLLETKCCTRWKLDVWGTSIKSCGHCIFFGNARVYHTPN